MSIDRHSEKRNCSSSKSAWWEEVRRETRCAPRGARFQTERVAWPPDLVRHRCWRAHFILFLTTTFTRRCRGFTTSRLCDYLYIGCKQVELRVVTIRDTGHPSPPPSHPRLPRPLLLRRYPLPLLNSSTLLTPSSSAYLCWKPSLRLLG